MKLFKVMSILAAISICLTGCSSSSGSLSSNEITVSEGSESSSKQEEITIQVFIAASLKNAMEEIAAKYNDENPNVTIAFNSGSSGKLQTQIEEGAECDIFFSAGESQMTALVEGGFVEDEDVLNILKNNVVLIKPAGTETKVTGFENIPQAKNIALAGETVPVGQYSRVIFENLSITDDVMAMEVNECEDVTAVLSSVSEGSNEIGIVYKTDAMSVIDKIEIIAEASDEILTTPVIYPATLVKNQEADEVQNEAAYDFFRYLINPEASKVFESYGFSLRQ